MIFPHRLVFFLACLVLATPLVFSQNDLRNIDAETRVRRIGFRGNDTISEAVLREVIATQAPTGLDRAPEYVKFLLNLERRTFPFNPFETQKDLTRITRFYSRQGFLNSQARYLPNFNAATNTVDLLFSIEEGAPLLVRRVEFSGPDGESVDRLFEPDLARRWDQFRSADSLRRDVRLSQLQMVGIQQRTVSWMQNEGYPFARISPELVVDSTANRADIFFRVNPGPLSVFGDVFIDGLETIDPDVIRQMLAFKKGDRYSTSALQESKRRIFESSQFRIALFELPEQEADGTVDVRFNVREARLRTIAGSMGYNEENGLSMMGQWQHRNFFGNARGISVNTTAELKDADESEGTWFVRDGRVRGSVGYRRPYFLHRRSTLLASPFIERYIDDKGSALLAGVNVSVVYQLSQYRTIILRNTFSRVKPFDNAAGDSLYNEVVTSLSGTFGSVDNFLNRSRGFLVTPFIEVGGLLGFSDVNYLKIGMEASAYWQPLKHLSLGFFWRNFGLAGRVYSGRIWPRGDEAGQTGRFGQYEDRYDRIRFYAGGSNDVRGWRDQWLGRKFPSSDDSTRYEPEGGLGKLAANLELRFPIPFATGLEADVFIDGGKIWEETFSDSGFRFSTGVGLRYATPWSVFRLEIARKMRTDPSDLVDVNGNACTAIEFARGCGPWRLIFGVTQAF